LAGRDGSLGENIVKKKEKENGVGWAFLSRWMRSGLLRSMKGGEKSTPSWVQATRSFQMAWGQKEILGQMEGGSGRWGVGGKLGKSKRLGVLPTEGNV